MENGHTLHLVERQPAQSQPLSGTGSGETTGNNGNRGCFWDYVAFTVYWVWTISKK